MKNWCKLGLASLLGFVAASLSGCGHLGVLGPGVLGSGNVVSETRDLTPFKKITFSGAGSLVIEAGKNPDFRIELDDNLLEYIATEVVDGNLRISSIEKLAPSQDLKVFISMEEFDGLTVQGSCNAEITGTKSSNAELSIVGAGKISIEGIADHLALNISGAGNIAADELYSKSASIKISGSGSVDLRVSEELKINITGSGKVRYFGSPAIEQRVTGSGRVIQVQSTDELPAEVQD
ncbi:MAG TPA: head GIN domain-containing protein [Pirellulaceae bacterium]|nr:head GIN domain-containing protein [Pirellulaceae bacterium]HMO93465.1 head GIN domain-containing protein [Pirellulaceae bacterium]HMP69220.1 head GIN domain-containing protein [Pirellulaceae bacterium]